ncbi:MAG TPA: DUF1501 domain-containing protein [Thermoanaerobaculia bacterium]|nr:DUF1501 domain-containing protein [Thermoanaerobaculia bacterium]
MWTRRAFLKAGGLALFAAGAGGGPAFLGRTALAAARPTFGRRKVLVTVFLRGAMDGLAAVSPLAGELGGPALARLRPALGLERGDGLDLGVGFALHPAFSPLLPLWRDGRLAVVHAVGSPDPTRSHFDAQDYMESGTPGVKATRSGWLNRAVGLSGHDASPFTAVALTGSMPRTLAGSEAALAVEDLRRFEVDNERLRELYADAEAGDPLLGRRGGETFEAVEMLSAANLRSYRPAAGADYPRSPLGSALRQVAFLVKAQVGLEVAFAESGGWDTHVRQGAARGAFARRADDLARSLAALWTDLGEHRSDVVVMTMTEFGRTAAQNGSGGTDHGHASCAFVLGDAVDGGRVHGRWPGLGRDDLYQGRDLAVATDFRSLFAGVAGAHLGLGPEADGAMFPGWAGGRLGVMRV